MKNVYLVLAIIGFIIPNIFVFQVSYETGNILLYLNPTETISGMLANKMASIFVPDLLYVLLVFFFWTYIESKKHVIKKLWALWITTLIFGIASGGHYFHI